MSSGGAEGVRARARRGLTEEIKACARRQLAENGAGTLSLRAVARELGMVSSALYRYFPSRDALLTALLVDADNAVGATAEAAVAVPGDFVTRWCALTDAVRAWARQRPQDYALLYGSPVPGYRAAKETVGPSGRVSGVALRLVAEAFAAGEIDVGDGVEEARVPSASDLSVFRQAALGIPDAVLLRALGAWAQLFGHLTFELFGHLQEVIDDYDVLFGAEMSAAARRVTGAT